MSKATAIDGLLAGASQEFSRCGYEGASLRDIAARAGVTLSTIHRYFGSKLELYAAVHQRTWDEINVERDARLKVALAEQPPRIEAIMRALIEPVVLRVFGDEEQRYTVDLLRASIIERRHFGREAPLLRNYTSISRRWLAAIRQALPELAGDTLVWGFSFAVGSLYSWQLLDHVYDDLLPHEREVPASEITDMLVAFCSAGFRAL